jgi:hypothetical protein
LRSEVLSRDEREGAPLGGLFGAGQGPFLQRRLTMTCRWAAGLGEGGVS